MNLSKMLIKNVVAPVALLTVPAMGMANDDQAAKIAKQLNNPVAALITVPMEYVHDSDIGPNKTGDQKSIKFTPVVPIDINEDWNLISRTIFSAMDQDIPEYGLDENGMTDIVQAMYFSPKKIPEGGLIWGVGPIILLDTATDESLGAEKWGIGPAGVILKQSGPWSVGALGHYLTDVAGEDDRTDVEQIFLQPFVSYNFSNATSVTVQSEGTWDLEGKDYGGVAIASLNQTFRLGGQLLQARIGVRHWYERSGYGPDSTEVMARLTLLFPK
ncbi:MAG: hypothetical protein CL693_06980 [Cellvibrionaceae bacterium]|nr:hypothetical protein [Cellvibrionaceae bacterium]|tara:strand:+ start:40100 stop:40915 length:816 start_codon:yes stop_codon:yes gene_type:complete